MTTLGIGLMSGTSLDGIDAAVVDIASERDVGLVAFVTRPYGPAEHAALLDGLTGGGPRSLALLHRHLGVWMAEAALAAVDRAGVDLTAIDFVASHGQTIWHEPGQVSLQLGCAATLAESLGTPVVSDFRSRDIAAGGEGAPLVPLADAMLFGADEGPRTLLNIGGMANVAWVPHAGATDGVVAFDTGPGVAVVDAVARSLCEDLRFDVDGARAAAGTPDPTVVQTLLEAEFFDRPPPKSTGREAFGLEYAMALIDAVRTARSDASADDCIATATALTVQSIADQCRRWLPALLDGDLVVSGGGARNPVLVDGLRNALAPLTIRYFDEVFFDGDAKEAVAFAYLGWRTLEGLPGNVPSATGASGPRVLGAVTFP
jgi:anhydro-N-acetylmuramic acid kinase